MVSFGVQVTVDSAHPHELADWWAETLGWEVEHQDPDFIRSMVAQGHATDDDTTTHNGALVWGVGAAIVAPQGSAGGHPRILFQRVPESKTVKNRVHLDIRTGDADVRAVVARLVERGATVVGGGRQGPQSWTTLQDPEGNEFCV